MIYLEPAKFLRFFSDMHQDFYINPKKFDPNKLWYPEPLAEDKDSILILAGDIWHAKKPFTYSNFSWFKEISTRFKYILVILGNHDFWNGTFPTEYENFERYTKEFDIPNLYLLQDNIIHIGNHKFIGSTLWTNYNDKDIETISLSESISSDLRYMRYRDPLYKSAFKRIKPKNFLEAHNKSIKFIFENATKDNEDQTLWVITHHPATSALINDPDLDEKTMGLVTSHYDEQIASSPIDYWIHGHNHQSGQAKVGNTTILSNTVGYLSASDSNAILNSQYNPWIQIPL